MKYLSNSWNTWIDVNKEYDSWKEYNRALFHIFTYIMPLILCLIVNQYLLLVFLLLTAPLAYARYWYLKQIGFYNLEE